METAVLISAWPGGFSLPIRPSSTAAPKKIRSSCSMVYLEWTKTVALIGAADPVALKGRRVVRVLQERGKLGRRGPSSAALLWREDVLIAVGSKSAAPNR